MGIGTSIHSCIKYYFVLSCIIFKWWPTTHWSLVAGSMVLAPQPLVVLLMPSLVAGKSKGVRGVWGCFWVAAYLGAVTPLGICASICLLLSAAVQIPESCSCQSREWFWGERKKIIKRQKKLHVLSIAFSVFQVSRLFLHFAV